MPTPQDSSTSPAPQQGTSRIQQIKDDLKSKQHRHPLNSNTKSIYDTKSKYAGRTTDFDGSLELDNNGNADTVKPKNRLAHPQIKDFFTRPFQARTTSLLKPNSSFVGSQQSGRSTYEVKVDLKEVDLSKSHICGFLTIHGLTESHPEITTFFKGEVIGPHYSFYTDHDLWESSRRNDLQHWGRFPSWRNLGFDQEHDFTNEDIYKNALNNEYLYMRWKELFLVPDAKVKDIRGASFAGFYYVCFNQLTGSISGLYFHRNSDRFQQLELSHIPDGGVSPSYYYA